MLGTFDEITEQGFNVDEILQQYNQTTAKQSEQKQQKKQKEANRQNKMLSLVRQRTSMVSERDYVARTMNRSGKEGPDDSFLEEERKKAKK